MKYFLFYAFIFVGHQLVSQQLTVIDSLESVADTISNDRQKVDVLNMLAQEYTDSSSLRYAAQAGALSRKINYTKGEIVSRMRTAWTTMIFGDYQLARRYYNEALSMADSVQFKPLVTSIYNGLGATYYYESDFENAIHYFKKSLAHKIEEKDTLNMAAAINNIAIIYEQWGNLSYAAENYFQALEIYEALNEVRYIATVSTNLGVVFRKQEDYQQALKYYYRALSLTKEGEYGDEVITLHTNIGTVFLDLEQYDSALAHYQRSLDLSMQLNNRDGMGYANHHLGAISYKLGDLDRAMSYYNKAYQIRTNLGRRDQLSETALSLGELYLDLGDLKNAQVYSQEAYLLATEINFLQSRMKASEQLAQIFDRKGQLKRSYDFFKEFHELSNEVTNDEQTKKIAKLEAQHEFKVKKDSILFAAERDKIFLNEKIERQGIIQTGSIIGLVLLCIILFILFHFYRMKTRANEALNKLNTEIENRNDQLNVKNREINKLRETERLLAEETISLKERELATYTMLTHQKNTLLEQVGKQIEVLGNKLDDDVEQEVKEIGKTLKANISDETWSQFVHQFEKVHPRFFENMRKNFGDLTQNDLRLSAYVKVGMDTKAIANVLNITDDAVRKSLYRMKKKMALESDVDLRQFLVNY